MMTDVLPLLLREGYGGGRGLMDLSGNGGGGGSRLSMSLLIGLPSCDLPNNRLRVFVFLSCLGGCREVEARVKEVGD